VYDGLGDPQQALTYYQQALPIRREVGDRAGEATTLNNIGSVYDGLGDPQQALTYYQQALPIRREVGDRAGEATTLNNIGGVRFLQGDFAGAKEALDEVVGVFRVIGDRASQAMASFNMAVLLVQMKRVDDAADFQRQAIALAELTDHPALGEMRAFLVQLEQATKGGAMGTATVEVSGAQAEQWAVDLQAVLAATAQPGDSVSPVEVQRSAELVIAALGLVFAGIDSAKTIWDWWHSRRPDGATVTILLGDGTQIDLSNVSQDQLEAIFQRAVSHR
ncbi:tetratricopeptide repeat protein, partial [Actinoplanes sp. NPDC049681]|uniref:tetratricopeptide repeat protein n=1 Tax=Actinoplanes sp. NPDC049681 TaxID=3363905 RepID=UPI0037A1ED41